MKWDARLSYWLWLSHVLSCEKYLSLSYFIFILCKNTLSSKNFTFETVWQYFKIQVNTIFLHDCIISLRWEVWTHKPSLTLPLSTEVPVPSQESEWSCICVLEVLILATSTIFRLDFGTVETLWYYLLSILLHWVLKQ